MTTQHPITTLFLDLGGVLLTNGWDRQARQLAAETFHLDYADMDERHHLTFDTYEEGQLSLDEYLQRVVFYKERPFSKDDFKSFMFERSQPYHDMLKLIRDLKTKYGLKIVAVNNEGRELSQYRIQQFNLREVIDTFVSSCFVHHRKPDHYIYQIALDISQTQPNQVVYIDDRLLFVEVARGLGIQGIHHTSFQSTSKALEQFALKVD
jgi:putative hydrolase of the HAD superfamily